MPQFMKIPLIHVIIDMWTDDLYNRVQWTIEEGITYSTEEKLKNTRVYFYRNKKKIGEYSLARSGDSIQMLYHKTASEVKGFEIIN